MVECRSIVEHILHIGNITSIPAIDTIVECQASTTVEHIPHIGYCRQIRYIGSYYFEIGTVVKRVIERTPLSSTPLFYTEYIVAAI